MRDHVQELASSGRGNRNWLAHDKGTALASLRLGNRNWPAHDQRTGQGLKISMAEAGSGKIIPQDGKIASN